MTTIASDTIQTDTVARSLAVPKDTTVKAVPKPSSATPTTTASLTTAAPAPTAGGLTQQMTPYLGNAALPKGRIFPLTGITFQPGSLSMAAGAQATITELSTILKTYPRLQIQLVGYANDAKGDLTNKSLSFKRVNQIKQQLMASGIDFVRIDAIGRGTGVAKNDTSGIAKPTLRKIDLKVVVK
ncbi:OmpA family protein [Spirosoma telluris]|uniref:OmpA family protein n=1 Tax=Spirosoma telluris TaxID=2183553 RepID=UPI002FC31D11